LRCLCLAVKPLKAVFQNMEQYYKTLRIILTDKYPAN
jgi:hypothetical protein